MTSPLKFDSPFWLRYFRQSHRSFLERWTGLIILFALAFAFQALNGWITTISVLQPALALSAKHPLWTGFYAIEALSFWTLWRRHSLHQLKFELCLYLSQFLFLSLWSISYFFWSQSLLAMLALALQSTASLLCALVFWKKERLAGQWMLFCLAWGIYLCFLNMALCLYNP